MAKMAIAGVKKIKMDNLAGNLSLVVTIIMLFVISANPVAFADSASWWNYSWPYARLMNVSTPNNLTDYQINIEFNSANVGVHWNWSSNGNDLRFTGFFLNGDRRYQQNSILLD